VCPLRIILLYPLSRILLHLFYAAINLLPECDGVKLIQYRLVEALTDTIGLGRPGLCFRVVDIAVQIMGVIAEFERGRIRPW